MDDDEWHSSPDNWEFHESLQRMSPEFARAYSRLPPIQQQVAYYLILEKGDFAAVAWQAGLEVGQVRSLESGLLEAMRADPKLGLQVCSYETEHMGRTLGRIVRPERTRN